MRSWGKARRQRVVSQAERLRATETGLAALHIFVGSAATEQTLFIVGSRHSFFDHVCGEYHRAPSGCARNSFFLRYAAVLKAMRAEGRGGQGGSGGVNMPGSKKIGGVIGECIV